MRNNLKNRITAILSLICMITSLCIMPNVLAEDAAASEEAVQEKVEYANADKAGILQGLGIISGTPEEFCAKEGVTRAEMADIMVKMTGMSESASEESPTVHFTDVDDESKYASSINLAVQLGIINGNGNYKFSPDEYVSYEAMVKMAIIVLGYEVQAQLQGGYPMGYMTLASKLGLNKIGSVPANGIVNGDTAVAFLYKMLGTDIAYITGVGESVNYTSIEGRNVLTENLKVKKHIGIVTANKNTGLYGDVNIDDNEITIDKVKYIYDGDSAALLGRRVEVYYSNENSSDIREVVCLMVSDRNKIITVDADDAKYNGTSYTYYDENDKEKIAKLYDGAALIYNGKAVTSPNFDMSKLGPNEGSVTLIDNDMDNTYDVVIVSSYINVVVDSVDTYTISITDKYDASRNVLLRNGGSTYDYEIYDKNGKAIELESIVEYDVLSVEQSDDNEFYIRKSSDTISGTVNRTTADNDTVYIDGVAYKISHSYLTSGQAALAVGDNGTYLLDVYGKIAGKKIVKDTTAQIGFVTKLGVDRDNPMDVSPVIKIFTIMSEEETFTFAKNVEIDGKKFRRNEANSRGESKVVNAILEGTNGYNAKLLASASAAQIVRYKCNSEGEITMIDTQAQKVENGEDENTLKRNVTYSDSNNGFFKKYGMNIGGLELVETNTIVYIVTVPFTGRIEEDIVLSSGNYFSDNDSYLIESYSYTKDKIGADVVICYEDYSDLKINKGSSEMLVDEIGYVLGDDGIEMPEIRGYHNGKYSSYPLTDGAKIDFDVQQGDLIRFNKNSKNQILALDHVYDAENDEFAYTHAYRDQKDEVTGVVTKADGYCRNDFVYSAPNAGFDVQCRLMQGYLYHRYDKQLIVARAAKGDIAGIEGATLDKANFNDAYIYVYDRNDSDEPVRLGTTGDLIAYKKNQTNPSRVIIRMGYGKVDTILVIK